MNKFCTFAFDQLILSFCRFNIKIQISITTILPRSYIKTHQKLHTLHNLCLLCVKQDGHHHGGSPQIQMFIPLTTSFQHNHSILTYTLTNYYIATNLASKLSQLFFKTTIDYQLLSYGHPSSAMVPYCSFHKILPSDH